MIGPVKRLPLFLAVFVALALLAAGCGDSGSSGPAATVNGVEISQGSVVDELDAMAGNADYAAQIEQSSGQQIHGEADGSYDGSFVALVLSRQIAFELIAAEVADRGLEATDAAQQAALDDLYDQIGQGDVDKGKALFEKFPQAYQDQLVEWNTNVLLLQTDLAGESPLTEESEQAFYDAHPEQFATEVCAAHILVDSEEKANELKAQLDGGADFATLAKENSTDTGSGANGGDLGCAPKGTYVTEFENAAFSAPIGDVVGPVQTQFGFHLIKVSDRTIPPFDEVKGKIGAVIASSVQAEFNDFFQQAVTNAEVTVDKKYGDWNAGTGQVDAPAAAGGTSTSSVPASTTSTP